jgi:acetyl-CoA carboxylase biotin carboxyl carrier protein
MTIEEIRELLGLFNESGVAEMEVQRGENRVRLKRASLNHEYLVQSTSAAVPVAAPVYASGAGQVQSAAPVSAGGGTGAAPALSAADAANEKHELVKSPIVGTYYDSASPGAAPFVRVGDSVEKGQVLCIIESMKLMNEIEAELTGTVMAKLVDNGKPVEYGQALFAIKPR